MPLTPEITDSPWSAEWSEIIDVRSPEEFAIDHIPGAINLPVLTDAERAKVGTIYRQISPFEARKIGAGLVAANIAQHIAQHFITKPKTYRPLIYCWRGSQRSGSLALVLSQIGWRVTLLTGGYKTYRHWVQTQLNQLVGQFTYRVISGMTGTGKTQVLQWLGTQTCAEEPMQILDLENLANHRGSLLGQSITVNSAQPSQKRFESCLWQTLNALNPSLPVWVEAESNKIGQIYLPKVLWEKLSQSPCIEINLPIEKRVQALLSSYHHFTTNPELLKHKLTRLKTRYGKAILAHWFTLIDAQNWSELVTDLLQTHYDPTYQHSIQQNFRPAEQAIHLTDLSPSRLVTVLPQFQALTQSRLN
jgi:tRNA 2-selenouridine synthase